MIDFKLFLYTDGVITNDDILTFDFTSGEGRGHITVKLFELFPMSSRFSVFLDMVNKADRPQETAGKLFDYLTKCRNRLIEQRDKWTAYTAEDKKDKAAFTSEINKYTRNLEALAKYYNFEVKQDAEKIPTKKITVCAMVSNYNGGGRAAIVNREGIKFEKYGQTFHAYKDTRTKQIYIIVPSCGIACATYDGALKIAPEFITADLVEKISKIDKKEMQARFLELLETSENLYINDDIKAIIDAAEQPQTAAEPAETEPAAAEALKPKKARKAPKKAPKAADVATAEAPQATEPATAEATEPQAADVATPETIKEATHTTPAGSPHAEGITTPPADHDTTEPKNATPPDSLRNAGRPCPPYGIKSRLTADDTRQATGRTKKAFSATLRHARQIIPRQAKSRLYGLVCAYNGILSPPLTEKELTPAYYAMIPQAATGSPYEGKGPPPDL